MEFGREPKANVCIILALIDAIIYFGLNFCFPAKKWTKLSSSEKEFPKKFIIKKKSMLEEFI